MLINADRQASALRVPAPGGSNGSLYLLPCSSTARYSLRQSSSSFACTRRTFASTAMTPSHASVTDSLRGADSRSVFLVRRDRSILLRNHVWLPDVYRPRSSPWRALGRWAKCQTGAPSQAHSQRQGRLGPRGHTNPSRTSCNCRRGGCRPPARRAVAPAGGP